MQIYKWHQANKPAKAEQINILERAKEMGECDQDIEIEHCYCLQVSGGWVLKTEI
jgi:hypothetical protein